MLLDHDALFCHAFHLLTCLACRKGGRASQGGQPEEALGIQPPRVGHISETVVQSNEDWDGGQRWQATCTLSDSLSCLIKSDLNRV